jgi:hypothetical protein
MTIIPAAIVGDTETLDRRKDRIAHDAFCWGNALGKAVRTGEGSVDYCVAKIANACEPIDALHGERMRRFTAERMAKAIQPEGTVWRR